VKLTPKTMLWISLAITVFVLSVAFLTGNSGLYILAGLSGASSIAIWQKGKTPR
jgi:succinate-acetate transporter protein